jgi:hypothetical protein
LEAERERLESEWQETERERLESERKQRKVERNRQKALREREQQKREAMDVAERIISALFNETEPAKYDFRCIAVDIENDLALLIAEDIVEKMPYHRPGGAIPWENCTLRHWLNNDFYNQFPEKIKSLIADSEVTNNFNYKLDAVGGNNTIDKIFLLSAHEAIKYFKSSGDRTLDDWWWLRSPGVQCDFAANVIDGNVSYDGYDVARIEGGVRPAMWVKLDS